MTVKQVLKAVEKFNKELEDLYRAQGERELPIVDCTIIGTEPYEPMTIVETKKGIKVTSDGETFHIYEYNDGGEKCLHDWDDYFDGLKEELAYQRERMRKAWRVFRSENPDAELERDEEN